MNKLQCPHCEKQRRYSEWLKAYAVTCGDAECIKEAKRQTDREKKIKCPVCKESHYAENIPFKCKTRIKMCERWGVSLKDYEKERQRRDDEQIEINLRCARGER